MKKCFKFLAVACVLSLSTMYNVWAQSVIFPQEQQPGMAVASEESGIYTLSNDVLVAKFKKEDNKLVFDGCEELGLLPGTELFKIMLSGGVETPASEITLKSVSIETLSGDANAVKGSNRFNGKALVAEFAHGDLTIIWRAVLRDGSHYLRTEMDITANADVAMSSITPMTYIVQNLDGEKAPVVVGNTRGAVIASDRIFAGLETPMGLNSVEGAGVDLENFVYDSWNANDWTWTPGSAVPSEILTLGFADGDIVGKRGYLIFRQSGNLTVEFLYSSGNHRLNIVGVDLLDLNGNVVSSDYHKGYTGGLKENNIYTLNVPAVGAYMLRYFVETKTESITSSGTITLNKKVTVADLEYALAEGDTPYYTPVITEEEEDTPVTDDNVLVGGKVVTDVWQNDLEGFVQATNVPDGLDTWGDTEATMNVFSKEYKYVINKGTLTVGFTYTSGGYGLDIVGVDLFDADGNNVAQDYHYGNAGNNSSNNTYTLDVAETAEYTLRIMVDRQDKNPYDTKGNISISLAENGLSGTLNDGETLTATWNPDTWSDIADEDVPYRVFEIGCLRENARVIEKKIAMASAGALTVTFEYTNGSHKLNMVGVDLLDSDGNVVANDYHAGSTGTANTKNVYNITLPGAGTYTVRLLADNAEEINSNGSITMSLKNSYTVYLVAPKSTPIKGVWRRNTTLAQGKTWNISAVVGLIAPGQARRSFLAYSERERAVPWRSVPVYISWYELNIDRNNASNPVDNMVVEQCVDVVKQWDKNLYQKYGKAPYAFVWDDGWDNYGTWTFHSGFPNGLKEVNEVSQPMGAGNGAWLGPVGGYGVSGATRRAYWADQGGMQLSNPLYRKVFVDACENIVKNHSGVFFKLDGISAQFSSVGPDAGTTGEENAEAIIEIEKDFRNIKEDLFFNTTVGTWASPFWFRFTDAVWRQENDYGEIGNQGSDREKWITYRDNLVHQNFITNSPLCPINTLMTHGFILTEFGNVSKNMDYAGVVRELRCAFACGSGMVELYNDYKLMNSINNGALWGDLAECMDWHKANADVLPDIHWVGGDPWDGAKANIYGWAAWNAKKAVLTLRNPAASAQSITLTLRQALDIPNYVSTTITLSDAFGDQAPVEGFDITQPIDIDKELTIVMPASSVFVYNGVDNSATETSINSVEKDPTNADNKIYDVQGRSYDVMQRGVNIVGGKKILNK